MSDEDIVARLLQVGGPRPGIPAERAARIRAGVEATWRDQVARRRRRRRGLGWLAASVAATAFVAAVGTALRPSPSGPPGPPSPAARPPARVEWAGPSSALARGRALASGERVSTGPAERLALRLAGGAALLLDTSSAVRIASASAVELETGAAYVDSETPSSGGVEIRTPYGTVRDVGTQFEARLLADALRLRVREGSVLVVEASASAATGRELVLAPGRKPESRAIEVYGPEWGWITLAAAPFDIDGRRLRTWLDWAVRQRGLQLRFDGPDVERRASEVVLHGSVAQLPPDEALAVVLSSTSLRHRLDGGILHVEPAR